MLHRRARQFQTGHDQHVIEATRYHRWLYTSRRDSSEPLRDAEHQVAEAASQAYPVPTGAAAAAVALRCAVADAKGVARYSNGLATADADVFGGELFARLFGNPDHKDHPQGQPWEGALHNVLDDHDAFRDLRAKVHGDPDFAALAAKGMLEELAGKLPRVLDGLAKEQDKQDGDAQPAPGTGAPSAADVVGAVMSRVCGEIGEQVDEARKAMAGLAPGLDKAPSAKDHDDVRRMHLAERLADDDELRDVLRKAGRLHRIHARTRKMRVNDGCEEVVDVERGGDLARLLPTELALLDDPDLGDWAMAKIIERKAFQYALAGTDTLGRGPIVLMRDISVSMSGAPHNWAAAVVLMCAQVAHKEHRQLTVINYNSGVPVVRRLDTDGRSYEWARHKPGVHWEPLGKLVELLLEVATDGVSGGTSMDPAMRWALDNGDMMADRADLVIVTDGRSDSVEPDLLARLNECKEQGLKIAGITVNRGALSRPLAQVCDRITNLDRHADIATAAAKGVAL